METNFREGMADILEVDINQITDDHVIEGNGLDSLAMIAIIALIDEVYQCTVSAKELRKVRSVREILELVLNHKE